MTTISGLLIAHVRKILADSIKEVLTENVARHGTNAAARFGLSAYVLAVASVEAVMNEAFLGHMAQSAYQTSPLWGLGKRWVENLELGQKVLFVPQLLFNQTLDPTAQPYQDFKTLLRVRNDIVHYKRKDKPPKYVGPLSDRGIALTADEPERSDYSWTDKLSSTHCILWAHNTACETVLALEELTPKDKPSYPFLLAPNFQPIPQSWLANHLQRGQLS